MLSQKLREELDFIIESPEKKIEKLKNRIEALKIRKEKKCKTAYDEVLCISWHNQRIADAEEKIKQLRGKLNELFTLAAMGYPVLIGNSMHILRKKMADYCNKKHKGNKEKAKQCISRWMETKKIKKESVSLNKTLQDALDGKSGHVAKTYAEYEQESIINEFSFLKGARQKASDIAREKRRRETHKWIDKKRKAMATARKAEVERRLQAIKRKRAKMQS